MHRYRITSIEYKNGTKSFTIQKKIFKLFWIDLTESGRMTTEYLSQEYNNFEEAVEQIKKFVKEEEINKQVNDGLTIISKAYKYFR